MPAGSGFISLIAVILLATGTLAFSVVTISAAASYSDSVMRHELRLQAGLNLSGCLDTAELMIAKDYFLNGNMSLSEFACVAGVSNNFNGNILINATATLSGVSARGSVRMEL